MSDPGSIVPGRKRKSRFDQHVPIYLKKEVSSENLFSSTNDLTNGESSSLVKRPRFVAASSSSTNDISKTEEDINENASESKNNGSSISENHASVQSSTSDSADSTERRRIPLDWRNRYLSDDELNKMIPSEGYTIVPPPPTYVPIRVPAHKLMETPEGYDGYVMPSEYTHETDTIMHELERTNIDGIGDLQYFKASDAEYFQKALGGLDESDSSTIDIDALKERKILRLLLQIKNGTPRVRKTAMRQLVEGARDFGAGPLFDKLLPLMMERSLDDQERHLLVKVIDRILFQLDSLVRPYVHKILVVTEPLLIDESYFTRVEGRQVITNLAKAAGLAHMIATMRPDIDHEDEYVRNTTARAFAVVASALGIPAMMPFLKAVCRSKKSWLARHTGIRIIQQIALLIGVGVLPYLPDLVDAVSYGLADDEDQPRVRTMAALCIAALAESSAPYGIEAFDNVLGPIWIGIRRQRGRNLAASLKAVGFLIPLMDNEYAAYYTEEMTPVLVREFANPDEDMRKVVLQVIRQVVATPGVEPSFVRERILPEYFRFLVGRRMAMNRRTYRNVVDTTVALARSVGAAEILHPIVLDLKDANESYRNMVAEIITHVLNQSMDSNRSKAVISTGALSATVLTPELEDQLINGIIYAFLEQSESMASRDNVMLEAFSAIAASLNYRLKPYLDQIDQTILWRLNHKSAAVRMQAADLTTRLIPIIADMGDQEQRLSKWGSVLYEQLSEEFPETLGSIIAALAVLVISIPKDDLATNMNPPIRDLLPRFTPILRNRHEKVQENSIKLISAVADRAPDQVAAREWMRICFELIEILKTHRRIIRRTAMRAFGFIARAIGPQDVLVVLLTNLRVQDRQTRASCTVAIAIVAEFCGPFTCIPSILTEYRVPELTVRNGCLKALGFIFEYIGMDAKNYIYSVLTCVEDALTDRDLTLRTTGAFIIKNLAIDTFGQNREDANMHLLNLIWPNILETAPHVVTFILDAVDALRLALGPSVILNYSLQGLFHPARRVRDIYWQIYNQTYLASQDALTAYYPSLDTPDDASSVYDRHELFSWL